MKKITVIIPCLNEEDALPIYYKEMSKIMKQMKETEIELLFVDDGSTDRTLSVMKDLHELDGRCHYLSFSRNFGKEAAMYAGFCNATGDYVAIMDVDLQDPPALLPKMYRILEEEGYDSVATKRSTRTGEPKIRSFLSKSFYNVINRLSKTEIVNGARDYRLMKRNMVDAVLSICYSLEGITGFSVAPLSFASVMGIAFCILSFLMIGVIIFRTLIWGDPVSGWPSLACIIFFVGGIQLLCTGIVGQYLSKTYLETKHRPIYIIKDSSEKEKGAAHVRESIWSKCGLDQSA